LRYPDRKPAWPALDQFFVRGTPASLRGGRLRSARCARLRSAAPRREAGAGRKSNLQKQIYTNKYSADYYVTVTSSDTNNCAASPSELDYGTVTWTVVNTNATTVVIDPSKTLSAMKQAISMIQSVASAGGCTGKDMTCSGNITCAWQQVCCNITNGPYKQSSVSGSIKVGLPTLTCQIPGLSLPIPYPVNNYLSLGFTFGIDGSGNASASLGVAQPCQQQPICVYPGASLKGTLALAGKASAPFGWATCSASGGATGGISVQTSGPPDNSGNCLITATLGDCKLIWSADLQAVGGVKCVHFGGSQPLWPGYVVTNSIGCLCF